MNRPKQMTLIKGDGLTLGFDLKSNFKEMERESIKLENEKSFLEAIGSFDEKRAGIDQYAEIGKNVLLMLERRLVQDLNLLREVLKIYYKDPK